MNLTNKNLIALIQTLGETKTLNLLESKLDSDLSRKEYHKKYNAQRNAVMKLVREKHPEMFKTSVQ